MNGEIPENPPQVTLLDLFNQSGSACMVIVCVAIAMLLVGIVFYLSKPKRDFGPYRRNSAYSLLASTFFGNLLGLEILLAPADSCQWICK